VQFTFCPEEKRCHGPLNSPCCCWPPHPLSPRKPQHELLHHQPRPETAPRWADSRRGRPLQQLAAAGAGGLVWHAYLSAKAAAGKSAVNARDRIGKGPWVNRAGVQIARDVAQLHSDSNNLNKRTGLTEKGDTVNGRGDTPNSDILTGSAAEEPHAWRRGYHLRQLDQQRGGGQRQVGPDRVAAAPPTSWNSSHPSRGCGQQNLRATGAMGCSTVRSIEEGQRGRGQEGRRQLSSIKHHSSNQGKEAP
jgi:hypothetical protein